MIQDFIRITLTDIKPNIDQGRIQDLSRGGTERATLLGSGGIPFIFFNPKGTNTDIQLFLSHLEYKSTLIYFTIYSFLDRKWL